MVPVYEGDLPPDTLTFHTHYFHKQKIQVLSEILADHGHARMWELRWSIGCEIAIELFDPRYEFSGGRDTLDGAGEEGFWTTANRDSLIYLSHGQRSTPDRRGTW